MCNDADVGRKEYRVMKEEIGLKLEPGILNVQKLRIVLERHGSSEGCQEEREIICHHHQLADDGHQIDYFKVVDGRLTRMGTMIGILSVEEVDE